MRSEIREYFSNRARGVYDEVPIRKTFVFQRRGEMSMRRYSSDGNGTNEEFTTRSAITITTIDEEIFRTRSARQRVNYDR